jgi:pimeloyl-ACP methyl ester carboxylesterase
MPYPDNKVLRNGRLKGFKDGVSGAMKNKFAASWDLMMYTRKFDFSVESVKFPILLLHGERDKNVPVELVRFISGKLINSTLITFKSEAHFSILANQFEKALLHIKSS